MRHIKKPVFFIVVALLVVFTLLNVFGISTYYGDITTTVIKSVSDIRWGIDISGGVEVTFSPAEDVDATQDELDAAKTALELRLVNLGITDYEVYVDYSNSDIIVRFPWQSDEEDFDPEEAVQELGETAELTFREGYETDDYGNPSGTTADTIILTGDMVTSAQAVFWEDEDGTYEYGVSLVLNEEGTEAFAEATTRLAEEEGIISIWMDNTCISYPTVSSAITDGQCQITGDFTYEEASELAEKISAGSLPFALEASNFRSISASMGEGAKNTMLIAGLVAFIIICIYMIVSYKLPGVVACIALFGQVVGTVACVTGFFGNISGVTLTIPGIAGIILAVGIDVDANVVTFERVKEELRQGKTLDTALDHGYQKAWRAIFDGNITIVFVAIILMGAFGPSDSIIATIMKPIYFMFPTTIEGTIYSFGYTLLVGVIMNFIFGVLSSRLMLGSLSRFKGLRNPELYGGVKNDENL
ncbi:MAG: SecD/SecF family protein translocase subunit [Oscillospiraceae bacterium]|nr:SecD/SecF family protein translocase subunit [Oscillospiraceae bacterium]